MSGLPRQREWKRQGCRNVKAKRKEESEKKRNAKVVKMKRNVIMQPRKRGM